MIVLHRHRLVVLGIVLLAATAGASETLRVPVGVDTLAASVFTPGHRARSPGMILMPGSERMSREFYRPFAERFAREGFVAITFDRRGEGESTGLWDETQSLEPIADAGLAVLRAAIRQRNGIDSTFLAVWGVSQGGWTGTIMAAREPAIRFAILVSDPALTTHEENLNERAWLLREKGFEETEVREITEMRRILWRYYATGERPADFAAVWVRAKEAPWFVRVGWPSWEPTPDSLSQESLAGFRRNHDPVPFIRASHASVLRMYGREDRHMDPVASLAAARAAYRGIERDTTFVLYANRGHILESTVERPECPTCPHDMSRFANGFDFDEVVWQDVLGWVRSRMNR